jgi:predicted ribosomally synthesized peptide with nif11-like leader
MSFENAVRFWQAVQTDHNLQELLKPVREQEQEGRAIAVAKIAQDAGYAVTGDELSEVESVILFWRKAQVDDDLKQKLASAQQSETDEQALTAVMQVAKDAGHEFPREALSIVTGALADAGLGHDGELSEEELDQVAGGVSSGTSLRSSVNAALGGRFRVRADFNTGIGAYNYA